MVAGAGESSRLAGEAALGNNRHHLVVFVVTRCHEVSTGARRFGAPRWDGTVIEIRELFKYYGDFRALGPLSAEIESGEIIGLLGLNGAGKTTTLRILACDLLPTSGTVVVDGQDVVANPHAVRARTGYLPETPPLYPEMTVFEYLCFAARLRGAKSGDVNGLAEAALKQCRLRKHRDRVVGTLSHGYRQRVGIAQAIVHRPSLVVLDEPITGLDPVQIVEMRKLVRSLGGEHTVILSSHNLSEISETCDRILVITDGTVSEAGTEAELSAKWLGTYRCEVTVHFADGQSGAQIEELLARVAGVDRVLGTQRSEPGDRIASFLIEAQSDVRAEACRALVEGGVAVLGLMRSERELENVFLRLAGTDEDDDAASTQEEKA